jgi:hypothetical protein
MSEFPFDPAIPLDGTIGTFFTQPVKQAPAAADQRVLHVALFGDVASDGEPMGLADDLTLLVHTFIRDRASVERETSPTAPAPSSGPHPDIEIALHGLEVNPEEEHKLHRLICDVVRDRVAGEGTSK